MLTLAPGTRVGGKYHLERLLARGGMGSIWVGRDEGLCRSVAIKFMDPELSASHEARTRFDREARAAAQLSTPHVVQVFDHGVDQGTPFIVMELLEGEDLGKRLKRERQLSLRDAATIARQVGKALRRAHEAGIVHRDLKPQNIFITRSDDEEIVKVLDFGVAKATQEDGETTTTGSVIGSPMYMSPEQARGLKSVDHRSDLWSLGVILFRALTGKPPFTGEGTGDLIVKICSDPIPVPSTLSPGLSAEVDAFFARALARSPAERFQTVSDMVGAFATLAGTGSEEPAERSSPDTGTSTREASTARPGRAAATPSGAEATPWSPSEASGTLSSASGASDRVERRARRPAVVAAIGVASIAAVAAFVALRASPSPAPGAEGPLAASSNAATPPTPAARDPAPSVQAPVVSPAPTTTAAATSASARSSGAPTPTASAHASAPASPSSRPTDRAPSSPPHAAPKSRPSWGY